MQPFRSDPFAGRPILAAALAVALGSALGASGTVPRPAAVLAALAIPAAAAVGPSGSRRFLLPLFLVAASAVRASSAVPRAAETGPWRPGSTTKDWTFGDLGAGTPRIALSPDSADAGETLALLDAEPARDYARGPEPGRAARSGVAHPPVERFQDEVVRLGTRESGPVAAASDLAARVRRRLLARVDRLEDPRTRGLVGGLLFGDLSEVPVGVGDLFVRTGTFHVLAISGLQVVLVAVLIAGPLAALLAALVRGLSLGRLRPARETLRSALLVLFVPVAGAGAPVTRSALAWIAASLAARVPVREPFETKPASGPSANAVAPRFMRRSPDPLALWGFALLVECLFHPDAPLAISVELTFLATLGLVAGTRPMLRLLREFLPGRGRIAAAGATGRQRPEWVRVSLQRILDASLGAVAASAAAVLATLPIVWSRFGEWCPSGVLATPAIALPVAWILVAGWTWVAVPALVPEAVLDAGARATIGLLEAFDRLPGTPDALPPRPLFLLALACGGTFWALRSRRPVVVRATALVWAAVLLPWTLAPRGLEVHALDVGSGTAVLLREPGGSALVFDAGSRDRPGVDREALGPAIAAWEAERIQVVLSHPDLDHDGALEWLLERHPPAHWAGALPAHLAERLPHTTVRTDVELGRILLAWPEPGHSEWRTTLSRALAVDGNEGSRVLEVVWKGESLLLFGDSEADGLAAWIRARDAERPVRMMLFPHHGSDTEHITELLDLVRPEEVWISASGEPDVCRELARRGIRTRRTALEGPLSIELP